MKKLIVLVVALMAVGLLAYAQAPTVVTTIAGYLDGGFRYDNSPNGASNAIGSAVDALYFDGIETPTQGGRMNLNMSWTYGDAGMKMRFRAQNYVRGGPLVNGLSMPSGQGDTIISQLGVSTGYTGYDPVFVRRAWAFYNFFGGMLQANVGLFGIGDFTTSSQFYTAFDNPDMGLILFFNPIQGLEIGYQLPFQSVARPLSDSFNMSTIGAKYAIPNIGTFQAWIRNISADTSSPKNLSNPTSWTSDNVGGRDFVYDINITAVKNLMLATEAYMVNFADTLHIQENAFWVNVGYKLGALTIGWSDLSYLNVQFPYSWDWSGVPSLNTKGGTGTAWMGLETFCFHTYTPPGGSMTTSWFFTLPVQYNFSDTLSVGATGQYRSDSSMLWNAWAKLVVGKNYIRIVPTYDTSLNGGTFSLICAMVTSF